MLVIQVHTDIATFFVSRHFHLRTENNWTFVSFSVISEISASGIGTSSCFQTCPPKNEKEGTPVSFPAAVPQIFELSLAVDPRHPICCGWSWTVPPRGIAQEGAQKPRNTRSKAARELARLSWCQMVVPLAAQQKSTKKMVNDSLGQKNVRNSFVTNGGPFVPRLIPNEKNVRKVVKFLEMPRWEEPYGDSCAVKWIHFPSRRDLGGSLHPEIGKLTMLEVLVLRDTNVSGSLDVLANNPKLEWLSLRHTRVTGRLEYLSKAKNLRRLDLTGTEVTGHFAALANFRMLNHLRLSNTAMSGDLESLAKLKRLERLELANLKVVGEAAVVAEWSKIKQFELVKGPWWSPKWKCSLPPELRFLDVSGTPQFSLAQDLLRPFAGCGKLATLKAARSGLSGPLWPEILDSNGDIIPMYKWPSSQALSVLDLRSNNVTDVAKLPDGCRTLVLSGNPPVSFGAGVVKKAIKDMVFIDLRNATFGNLSDSWLLIGQLAVITHVLLSICMYL